MVERRGQTFSSSVTAFDFSSQFAVNWMNYGIMDSLGASNLNANLNRMLTALAAAGGSRGSMD